MLNASEYIDPVVRRACIVEDRTWRGGIEIISHVNYDQLARVRVALGVMPDACGRTLNAESFAMLALRQPSVSPATANDAAVSESPRSVVLWTDIMAQIRRVDPLDVPAPARPATTELHFGPVLHLETLAPLLRSA